MKTYECDVLGYCPHMDAGMLSCRDKCGMGRDDGALLDTFEYLEELLMPSYNEDYHDEFTIGYHRRQLQIEKEDAY